MKENNIERIISNIERDPDEEELPVSPDIIQVYINAFIAECEEQ